MTNLVKSEVEILMEELEWLGGDLLEACNRARRKIEKARQEHEGMLQDAETAADAAAHGF